MKKILPLLVVGILVLSGLGATAVINIENNPPDAPTIAGETRPKVGVSYCFTFITVDPDGDDVSYYIEWGDGTSTGWTVYLGSGEGASFAHTWDEIDWDNIIRCKAKDIHGAEGNWSKIQIPIMKNKDINLQSSSIPSSRINGLGAVAETNNLATMDNQIQKSNFGDDTTPPEIEVTWEAFKDGGTWYVDFICEAYDEESGIARVEMYINDRFHGVIVGAGPTCEFVVEWSKAFKTSVFKFVAYNGADLSAFVIINGSDIKSYPSSQSSSQQSSTTPSSQSVMSVIPSSGKANVATSRTTFNDGTLSGYVKDTSMNPIEGAIVRVYFHETYEENYTDSSGYYHVTNIPICYCMKNATCSKEGYRTEWVLLNIDENTTHDFILMVNQPPSAPDIEGPTVKPVSRPLPKVGEPWNYTFKSTDPDEDDVYYWIEWGDGTCEKWTGPYASGEEVIVSHTWSEKGTYDIRAKAKDIWGAESDWGTLDVIMPKNQQMSNMWFLRWLERFPILNQIVNLLMEKWI